MNSAADHLYGTYMGHMTCMGPSGEQQCHFWRTQPASIEGFAVHTVCVCISLTRTTHTHRMYSVSVSLSHARHTHTVCTACLYLSHTHDTHTHTQCDRAAAVLPAGVGIKDVARRRRIPPQKGIANTLHPVIFYFLFLFEY